jgi:TolB-like protein
MNDATELKQIQNHLENGELSEAFQLFKILLDRNPKQTQTARMVRVLESNFQQTRQQEMKGILAHAEARQEYARATDALLNLLETAKTGGKISQISPQKKMQRGLWLGIGLAGLVFLVTLFIWPKFRIDCPHFDKTKKMNVLILPFINLGNVPAKPHVTVKTRVEELAAKVNLSVSVAIKEKFNAESDLPSTAKVQRISEQCDADMVVWGQYLMKNDSIRLKIEFISQKNGKSGSTDFQNLPDLTFWNGQLDSDINDAVFSICARIAGRLENKTVTKQWLEKVTKPTEIERTTLARIDASR